MYGGICVRDMHWFFIDDMVQVYTSLVIWYIVQVVFMFEIWYMIRYLSLML
jgi:hypothetical protein